MNATYVEICSVSGAECPFEVPAPGDEDEDAREVRRVRMDAHIAEAHPDEMAEPSTGRRYARDLFVRYRRA